MGKQGAFKKRKWYFYKVLRYKAMKVYRQEETRESLWKCMSMALCMF